MSTAWYDALSAEDKARVDECQTLARMAAGELARLFTLAAAFEAIYQASGKAIMDTSGQPQVDKMPNPTGVEDASALSIGELRDVRSMLFDMRTRVDTSTTNGTGFDTPDNAETLARAAGASQTLRDA